MKQYAKRILSAGLALLLSASALPSTAFAASDSTSTLSEVTAKYIDAENGKEIIQPETYSVMHEEKSPQEIEDYSYADYTENVEYIYSHKDLTYIIGYPDESVRPDASMTRAEAATVFYRLYDGVYPEFERRMCGSTFEDVETSHWFYKEVETLYNIGIVDGTEEHKFAPDAPVTRAEFAVMAAKFANLDYEGGNIFEDVPAGHWAYSFIAALSTYANHREEILDVAMQSIKIVCGSKCASADPVQLQSRLNELTAEQTELLDRILEDMDNPDLNARLSELAAEKKTAARVGTEHGEGSA